MEHLLAGLNRAQHEAVTATEGYVRVIAGAGSGKTRALSHRFAYLVNELGILPGNILCVTFTNKSANEMRQRIHALTGDNDTGYINTFHGFCVSVLQEDSHARRDMGPFAALQGTASHSFTVRSRASYSVSVARSRLSVEAPLATTFTGHPKES